MDNRKQQPFYVGQRVVCIDASPGKVTNSTGLELNKIYKVLELFFRDAKDGWSATTWTVDVGLIGNYLASRFAPYDPPAIEIPAELLKEPVEERSDAPVWKEVICDNGQSFLLTPQPNP